MLILSLQWFGALPILTACDAGKAIYCAASMELDLEEAELVKQRVEEAGIAFMAEFPRRFAPATLRLKELIATRLGEPGLLFCHQRSVADTPRMSSPQYQGPRPTPARHLVELVDWCRYVVDRPAGRVFGLMHPSRLDPDQEDYQMMSLEFAGADSPFGGPVAQISCGRYVPAHWQEAINYRPLAALQVSCQHGIAFIDLPSTLVWFDEAGRHQESLDFDRPAGEHLLMQFHRAVTSLFRKTTDLEDAYDALRIVRESRRSCQEGIRVVL